MLDLRNKKIVLIEPVKGQFHIDHYVRDCSSYESGGSTDIRDPICLEYIASYIEQYGYSTEIIQQRDKTNEEVANMVLREKPFAVGISSLTYNFYVSLDIATKIKSVSPNTYVFFGGYHPTGDPTIVKRESIDYVVIGEGEETIRELLESLWTRSDVNKIRGIAYNHDGKIIVGLPRKRLNISKLPWPKRDISFLKGCAHSGLTYPPPFKQVCAAQVTYSRGCPYGCPFCASPRLWKRKVIYRDSNDVIAEIKHLKEKYGTNFIFFTDLTFNADKDKVFELCEKLIHAKLNVNWFAMAKMEEDYETAKIMKESGCSCLGFGVESLSDYSLKKIKPQQNFDKIKNALEVTDSVGISNRCYFLIGYPWDTKESIQELLGKMKQLKIDSLRMNFIVPFPGTKFYHEWKERLPSDLSKYSGQEPVVKCDSLTNRELVEWRNKLVNEYFTSNQFRNLCKSKIKRFPYWRESYEYFFDYLKRTGIQIQLN